MNISRLQENNTFTRVAPFVLFMAFIALEEVLRNQHIKGFFHYSDTAILFLYPIKALSTGLLILLFRRSYTELRWQELGKLPTTLLSLAVGITVFILWIQMDWPWAVIGTSGGYNPTLMSENFTYYFFIISRMIGAVLIVPIMEELFWRSWFLRYLISQDFQSVELGRFTFPSFLIGTVMFGLEHNLWFAGIMAGIIYSLLLYRTKCLTQCIIAHAATNLILSIYILQTGKWELW